MDLWPRLPPLPRGRGGQGGGVLDAWGIATDQEEEEGAKVFVSSISEKIVDDY